MTNKCNVLIIGGNGFIGFNLLKFLSKDDNIKLFSFDLNYPMKTLSDQITYIKGDFFNDNSLENAIKDKDLIIHSLCTLVPGNSNTHYMQGYQKDFIQTIKLCELVVTQKSNLIFLSSGGTVYGNQDIQPIKETSLPSPINHYGGMKLCIETVIKCFNRQYHSHMRIARISNPYGPGQDYQKGVGFIDAVLKHTLSNEVVEIWGDGSIIRDYIYIEDLCEMISALIYYDGNEEIFNIGSGIGISQNGILELLRGMGLPVQAVYKESRSVDASCIILNNTKICSIYKKKLISIDEGIEKYLDYLQKASHTTEWN